MAAQVIRRLDFIRKYMGYGLNFPQAVKAYRATMALMEDAVAAKSSIHFSKVGLLHAVTLRPRLVTMGFRRDKLGVHSVRREFVVGSRVEIRFRLYKKFARAHDLRG